MKIVIIDGQGGGLGVMLIEKLKTLAGVELHAVGTNSIATAAMLRAGASVGATGENAVVVACRAADIIVGPIGIVIADALAGEVTPEMARAVGSAGAERVLLPVNRCSTHVVAVEERTAGELATLAAEYIARQLGA